jgi:hypothetical protein
MPLANTRTRRRGAVICPHNRERVEHAAEHAIQNCEIMK